MAVDQDNDFNTAPQRDNISVAFQSSKKSPIQPSKSSTDLTESEFEKVVTLSGLFKIVPTNQQFPLLGANTKSSQKSRSLTQAEINMGMVTEDEVAALGERLQNEPLPMSLQEARERRASIKEGRKRSIDFIRSRTNSRAATTARPSLVALTEGQQKD